jgi:predicted nucleotidyltransferase
VVKKEHAILFSHLFQSIRFFYKKDLVSCAIFGSFARETATQESDMDILIVAENLPIGRIKRVTAFENIEDVLLKQHNNVLLSPIIKTPEEVKMGSPLFWDMTEDVIILYDKDNFLKNHLASVKERLKKNKAKKIKKGSAWYWILKEDYTSGEIFEL